MRAGRMLQLAGNGDLRGARVASLARLLLAVGTCGGARPAAIASRRSSCHLRGARVASLARLRGARVASLARLRGEKGRLFRTHSKISEFCRWGGAQTGFSRPQNLRLLQGEGPGNARTACLLGCSEPAATRKVPSSSAKLGNFGVNPEIGGHYGPGGGLTRGRSSHFAFGWKRSMGQRVLCAAPACVSSHSSCSRAGGG